jgi:hypothetical protein
LPAVEYGTLDHQEPEVSTTLVIGLVVLVLLLAVGTFVLLQRRQRETRQARVEANARRADADKRLQAAERERSIAEEQLARADRVDPDSG